jgi:hypothetical protein
VPHTPYARLLPSDELTKAEKQILLDRGAILDVVHLKQNIDSLLQTLKPSPLR